MILGFVDYFYFIPYISVFHDPNPRIFEVGIPIGSSGAKFKEIPRVIAVLMTQQNKEIRQLGHY
jgi:hypothetical protein